MTTPTPDQLAALRVALPDVEINDSGYLVKRTDAPTPQTLYQMTAELHRRVRECGFVLAVRAPFGANICGMVQVLDSHVNRTASNAPSTGPAPTPEDIAELAEIGRLVVVEKRLIWTEGTSLDACSAARHKVVDAVDAYLVKHPTAVG